MGTNSHLNDGGIQEFISPPIWKKKSVVLVNKDVNGYLTIRFVARPNYDEYKLQL